MNSFIVISGIIGCGKTTLTRELSNRTGYIPYFENVDHNPYLSDFYSAMAGNNLELKSRLSFEIQINFLTDRYRDHKQIQYSIHKNGVIQDRSIFEDGLFVEILHKQGILDHRAVTTYKKLFDLMSLHFKIPDLFIYLEVSPEIALERIKERSRSSEVSITLDYLKLLSEAYERWIAKMRRDYPNRIIGFNWNHSPREIDYKFLLKCIHSDNPNKLFRVDNG